MQVGRGRLHLHPLLLADMVLYFLGFVRQASQGQGKGEMVEKVGIMF